VNKAELMGRLTRTPELQYTTADEPKAYLRFSIAVNKKYKKDEANFIDCVAYGKTAETIEKYFSKGEMIAICGRIEVSQRKDKETGKSRSSWSVAVEEFYFTGSNAPKQGSYTEHTETLTGDEDLPF